MVIFTHDYEFKFGTKTLSGEAEFNQDGEATNLPSDAYALTTSEARRVVALFEEVTKAFHKFGGFDKIEIVKK